MFKIFSRGWARRETLRYSLPVVLLMSSCTGCHTLSPLPSVNLKEPGWTVLEGQAVWRTTRKAPELAGEVLLATQSGARAFVQFSKAPFPMLVAQTTTNAWQVELPARNKRYSGRGKPPARLIWLYLPALLSGEAPPKGWSWSRQQNRWKLENRSTGEALEGYFSP